MGIQKTPHQGPIGDPVLFPKREDGMTDDGEGKETGKVREKEEEKTVGTRLYKNRRGKEGEEGHGRKPRFPTTWKTGEPSPLEHPGPARVK